MDDFSSFDALGFKSGSDEDIANSLVQSCLSAGADPNIKDNEGSSALLYGIFQR